MSVAAQQYPLPLPHREAMGSDDFMITDSNREAVAWIDRWPEWPAHCLIIYGPAGSGKTHLAHVWQAKSQGRLLGMKDLAAEAVANIIDQSINSVPRPLRAGTGVEFSPRELKSDLVEPTPHLSSPARGEESRGEFSPPNVAIDNADKISGDANRERNLLHLYNILRETKGYLLLTAVAAPAQWKIELPDLRSRLLASPAVELAAPDDALLSALMIKQFSDRQLDIKSDVIDYILPRLTRTPEALRDLVAALDRASLAENRRITAALAKKVLEEGFRVQGSGFGD